MVADRDICLDETRTKLVPAGSVESRYQLINKGREIPEDEVARLGLELVDGVVVQRDAEPPPPAEPAPDPAAAGDSKPEAGDETGG